MSLTAPAPHPATPTGAASPAHRARPANATHAGGANGHAGPGSAFARLLQGAVDDEPDVARSSGADAADDPAEAGADTGTEADTATDTPHAAAHKKDEQATTATDPAAAPVPAPDAPRADLAQSLRLAGLAAAARAKAADAARGRHAAAGADAPGRADAGRSDRLSALGQAAAGPDATAASAGAVDIAGFQRVLDATPVNLATADAASASTAAAADFSLPSLGAGGGAAAAAAPEAPPAQATLAPPPGSPAFPAALGAQLNTWLKDGVQYATLELNPQDMGPIDVRIALHGGRTQVELGADVAETRAALADALPALADALGDVGLSLSGGSVSDQTGQHAREGEAQGQRAFAMPGWLAPARDGAEGAGAAARPAAQRGLVDLVA